MQHSLHEVVATLVQLNGKQHMGHGGLQGDEDIHSFCTKGWVPAV